MPKLENGNLIFSANESVSDFCRLCQEIAVSAWNCDSCISESGKAEDKNNIKRIVVIETDPYRNKNFADLKYPSQFVGVFEGANEDEIIKKAVAYQGVHPDALTLITA